MIKRSNAPKIMHTSVTDIEAIQRKPANCHPSKIINTKKRSKCASGVIKLKELLAAGKLVTGTMEISHAAHPKAPNMARNIIDKNLLNPVREKVAWRVIIAYGQYATTIPIAQTKKSAKYGLPE